MNLSTYLSPILIALVGCTTLACSSTTNAVRYDRAAADNDRRTEIEIGEQVSTACSLSSNKAFFTYNGTTLDPADKATLHNIAHCMTTGNLKDDTIIVMGHTDTTGSKAYNAELGMNRAEMVAKYLVEEGGVAATRIFVKSYGESGAKGNDADGNPYDRRVELRVTERE